MPHYYSFEIFSAFNQNLKKEKNSSVVLVELLETNLLIYNTLQFDQYSRLSILLNIFWFSAKII